MPVPEIEAIEHEHEHEHEHCSRDGRVFIFLIVQVFMLAACIEGQDPPVTSDSRGPDYRVDRGRDQAGEARCFQASECADSLACTLDQCSGGTCQHPLAPGYCMISGTCHAAGQANAQNACQRCDPTVSTSAWRSYPCVSTAAGLGVQGFLDGPTDKALFYEPMSVAMDMAGRVYIADTFNNRIRLIENNQVSTLAGSSDGFADGAAAQARFSAPVSVAVDATGAVYVADHNNHRIRKIASGVVSTVAGTGLPGFTDGPALSAQFNFPASLALGPAGQLYILDPNTARVRVLAGGLISTVAGDGTRGYLDGPALSARFSWLAGLAVDSQGQVFLADGGEKVGEGNHRIRLLSGGQVTTLAGDGSIGFADGPAAQARFNYPTGLALDGAGSLYIADTNNQRLRVLSGGKVSTLAGTGILGLINGIGTEARFNWPTGLFVNAAGQVLVADRKNHALRRVMP